MSKQYQRVMSAAVVAVGLLVAGRATAGSLDPANAPGPTMHTLEEIYQKVQNLAPQTLQTLSPATAAVNAGYYAATDMAQVDTDLLSKNIRASVTLFGIAGDSNVVNTSSGDAAKNDILMDKKAWVAGNLVTGTRYSAAVPKTGQTTAYAANDDGAYQKGVALPSPRFTVQADPNCVTDNLTGLIWARYASIGGVMPWSAAITYCEGLNYGGQTDWRLPNAKELYSLIDLGRFNPALPTGHPFAGVQSDRYWSSSTYAGYTGYAWFVYLYDGAVDDGPKANAFYVWPVRGGQ